MWSLLPNICMGHDTTYVPPVNKLLIIEVSIVNTFSLIYMPEQQITLKNGDRCLQAVKDPYKASMFSSTHFTEQKEAIHKSVNCCF